MSELQCKLCGVPTTHCGCALTLDDLRDACSDAASDAMAAKLEAAARWQCEPCDRLFRSPEEFMAHECLPKMYVDVCPKYKHGVFRYKPGESARCPGCFPDHASLAQLERLDAKPTAPGDQELLARLAESAAQTIAAQAPKVPFNPDITFRKVGSRDMYVCKVQGTFGSCDCCKPAPFFTELTPDAGKPITHINGSHGPVELTQPIRTFMITGILSEPARDTPMAIRCPLVGCECGGKPHEVGGPFADVSDQATAAVRRWRDAGGDDE